MIARRGFLGAMLAACAAPAIVRSSTLMRCLPSGILVPSQEIIVPPVLPYVPGWNYEVLRDGVPIALAERTEHGATFTPRQCDMHTKLSMRMTWVGPNT